MSLYPEWFKKGCLAFFNIDEKHINTEDVYDEYWRINIKDIYNGLWQGLTWFIKEHTIKLEELDFNFQNRMKIIKPPPVPVPNHLSMDSLQYHSLKHKRIGLTGKARSGKSTCADHLVETFHFHEQSFAAPLKHGLHHWFSFSGEQLWTELKDTVDERYNKTPRWFLQQVGTELFREQLVHFVPQLNHLKRSFWIENMNRWIDLHRTERLVVSDARFIDEGDFLKQNGFTIVKLLRSTPSSLNDPPMIHSSENNDILPDITIVNNFTSKKELYNCLEAIFINL